MIVFDFSMKHISILREILFYVYIPILYYGCNPMDKLNMRDYNMISHQ